VKGTVTFPVTPHYHPMSTTLHYRAWKLGRWLIGLFFVLFVFRLIYGFAQTDVPDYDQPSDFFSNVDLRKNYASEKGSFKEGGSVPSPAFAASQKYEKTATTRSRSTTFERDQAQLGQRIKEYAGVVQYEQRNGNPGGRQLHLLIGVEPEKFDSFYAAVQSIGQVRFTEITKVDKTNEYRQLNAKKASLEKTLVSLTELKSKGGDIDDYIALTEKIRGIEAELQDLGVDLGNFDTENEFCSVRFSLYEGAAKRTIGMMQRVKVALEWTLEYYALALVVCAGILITTLVLVLLVDRLRKMMGGGTEHSA
jgi:Domain of unknown function (DUF4349)